MKHSVAKTLLVLCLCSCTYLFGQAPQPFKVSMNFVKESNTGTSTLDTTFTATDDAEIDAVVARYLGDVNCDHYVEKVVILKDGQNAPNVGDNWHIKKKIDPKKGMMGVILKEIEGEDGIKITDVVNGFPAEKAGLRKGDIIVSINDTKLKGLENLRDAMVASQESGEVSLVYKRNGIEQDAQMNLKKPTEEEIDVIEEKVLTASEADKKDFHWKEKISKDMMKPIKDKAFLGIEPYEEYEGKGVKLQKVISNTGAAAANLKAEDIIVSIGNDNITSLDDLVSALGKYGIGDNISVGYTRAGSNGTAQATLGSYKEYKMKYKAEEKKAYMKEHAEKMEKHEEHMKELEKKPFLGVYLADAEDMVKVSSIIEGTAAEKAGLKAGDIIVKIDDMGTGSFDELKEAMSTHKVGDKVKVTYQREGTTRKASAVLGNASALKEAKAKASCCTDVNQTCCTNGFKMQQKAFLGVLLDDASEGLEITKVVENSAAQESGLQAGDIIVKVGKANISDFHSLKAVMKQYKVGDKTKITVLRDGNKKSAKATLKAKTYQEKCCEGVEKVTPGMEIEEVEVRVFVKDFSTPKMLGEVEPAAYPETNSIELVVEEFNLFPNPNDGRFTLSFNLPSKGDTKIEVFNGETKKVYEQTLSGFEGAYNNEIDLSNEPAGIYYIRVMQNNAF